MPRALWFVLAAGIAVWAAAFVQVDRRAPPAAAADPDPEPTDVPPARSAQVVPAKVAAPAAPLAQEPVGPPVPPGPQRILAQGHPRGVVASASATWRAARDAFVPGGKRLPVPQPLRPDQVATGELGDGPISPEYQALERAYAREPRDGAWASEQERLIRFTLRVSPAAANLAMVNCQQTICRVVLEQAEPDAFKQLVAVPELAQISGLSPTSPYSYRSGQLSVYFARRAGDDSD